MRRREGTMSAHDPGQAAGDAPDALFFIADAHIRPLSEPGEAEKQQRLISFIRSLHGRARALYILGDLFDFWFEYRAAVPARGGRVLAALADLADTGTAVTVFGGNHDWWIGPRIEQEYGLSVHHGPMRLEEQGLVINLDHGDGQSIPSRRYSLVRRILHHPAAIAAFRALHPGIAERIAGFVAESNRNRDRFEVSEIQLRAVYVDAARRLFEDGVDVAVFGHVHIARVEAGEAGTLVVLGDWLRLRTYGVLRGGVFSLETWHDPMDLPQ